MTRRQRRFPFARRMAAGFEDATMNIKISTAWFYGALIVALSILVLRVFLPSLVIACVTAVASWPLYSRFAAPARARLGCTAAPLLFAVLITVFVLAPMMFAAGALLVEANALLRDIAAADQNGSAAPQWLTRVAARGSLVE